MEQNFGKCLLRRSNELWSGILVRYALNRISTVPYIISYEMIALPSTDCIGPLWVDSSSWEVPCPLLFTRSSVERENGFCFNPHQFMWNSRRFQCSQSQGFTKLYGQGIVCFRSQFYKHDTQGPRASDNTIQIFMKIVEGKAKKGSG